MRQAEKVSQVGSGKSSNSPLYNETKKLENFLSKQIVKIKIRVHACKCYASYYNVDIWNSLNPELQVKDTESAFNSNLIDLLTQIKGCKFVTTLVLVLKKVSFFSFFFFYNLHFFEQKTYSHQVLIYLNVPGIPVRKPL